MPGNTTTRSLNPIWDRHPNPCPAASIDHAQDHAARPNNESSRDCPPDRNRSPPDQKPATTAAQSTDTSPSNSPLNSTVARAFQPEHTQPPPPQPNREPRPSGSGPQPGPQSLCITVAHPGTSVPGSPDRYESSGPRSPTAARAFQPRHTPRHPHSPTRATTVREWSTTGTAEPLHHRGTPGHFRARLARSLCGVRPHAQPA